MSDGPQKMVPKAALPLDEIILGEDEALPPAAPAREASVPPPAAASEPGVGAQSPTARSSVRPKDRASVRPVDTDNGARDVKEPEARDPREKKRAKMTLRIPDDEVSRPTLPSVETPAAGIPSLLGLGEGMRGSRPPAASPAEGTAAPPMRPRASSQVDGRNPSAPPMRAPDDTIELSPEEVRARMAALDGVPRALGVDASHEPGWTPYAPPVADDDVTSPIHKVAAPVLDLAPEVLEDAPVSEEIPVDTDLDSDLDDRVSAPSDVDDLAVTHPRLPTVLDSEEIRLEDGDRVTDPGAEEISTDDVVSVESLPKPGGPPPPPRGQVVVSGTTTGPTPKAKPSSPQATSVTATSLMAGAAQPSAPEAPVTPTPVTPATPATGAAVLSPQVSNVAPPMASGGPARRTTPSSPQVVVQPVGALAPPPMNEAAANRKKTRPWWEDLFNDDFIRTMAKLTDGQIGREVDFIEESLGCEAGAMVLDLACGTGRHAVELASRGYQVVGFDLSLSMLARASDEAQDRKQKINFVQGDMREMTFDETFDGVYSWNTSFGYFDEEKNAAIVAKVHRALKKGGQFLLDVVNRDNIIRQSPSLAWYEGDGCICMDEMHIDWITSRMKVKRTLMMDDGRTKEIEYSIRVYSLHELGKLLHDNGFRVAEVSGRTSTPGVFFGCEAPRTLILAEKR